MDVVNDTESLPVTDPMVWMPVVEPVDGADVIGPDVDLELTVDVERLAEFPEIDVDTWPDNVEIEDVEVIV